MWPAELFFETDLDWDSRDIRSTSAGFFATFSAQIIFSWLENVNKHPISYLLEFILSHFIREKTNMSHGINRLRTFDFTVSPFFLNLFDAQQNLSLDMGLPASSPLAFLALMATR